MYQRLVALSRITFEGRGDCAQTCAQTLQVQSRVDRLRVAASHFALVDHP
jgi:hypothetical protein